MVTRRLAIAVTAGIIAVAASLGARAQEAAPLKVYAAGEITPGRYSVVRRLWVDSTRSAFEIPRYSQSGEAIGAIVKMAAREGADGVVNLYCVDDHGGAVGEGGFLCYALAIKLK